MAWLLSPAGRDVAPGLVESIERLAADGILPGLRCCGAWYFNLFDAAEALDAMAEGGGA